MERLHFILQCCYQILKLSGLNDLRTIHSEDLIQRIATVVENTPPSSEQGKFARLLLPFAANADGSSSSCALTSMYVGPPHSVVHQMVKQFLRGIFQSDLHNLIKLIPCSCFDRPSAFVKILFVLRNAASDNITDPIGSLFKVYKGFLHLMDEAPEAASEAADFNEAPAFADDNEKDFEQLLAELQERNVLLATDPYLHQLRDQHDTFCSLSRNYSVEFRKRDPKQSKLFKLTDEVKLADEMTKAKRLKDGLMILILCCHNVHMCFGHFPRPSQLLALLLFMNKASGKGRLLQINTGEGKSDIVAIFAAYSAVKHKAQVDIVTSGEQLAQRDAQFYKQFYENVSLTVAHNIMDCS